MTEKFKTFAEASVSASEALLDSTGDDPHDIAGVDESVVAAQLSADATGEDTPEAQSWLKYDRDKGQFVRVDHLEFDRPMPTGLAHFFRPGIARRMRRAYQGLEDTVFEALHGISGIMADNMAFQGTAFEEMGELQAMFTGMYGRVHGNPTQTCEEAASGDQTA